MVTADSPQPLIFALWTQSTIRRLPSGYAADAGGHYADGIRVVGKTLADALVDLFTGPRPTTWPRCTPPVTCPPDVLVVIEFLFVCRFLR